MKASSNVSFETLPVELIQAILSAIPDIPTLKAAVLSAPIFHSSFYNVQCNIISDVLLREVSAELYPDAVVVLQSSLLKDKDGERALELLAQWHLNQSVPDPQWDLSLAAKVSMLHKVVTFFGADFASLALSTNPVTGSKDVSSRIVQSTEWIRIHRAFYNYDLCCNLFRRDGPLYQHEKYAFKAERRKYFEKHSSWEIFK